MLRIELKAPAKLNLHLGIYNQLDERRYHRADSLMVALDVCDRVVVEDCADGGAPTVVCEPSVDVPVEKNTAYRAACALGERVGRVPSVDILIKKHVPDQAGMGGSSADAAAVLRALCALWDVSPQDECVVEAARAVGADVPFFLDPVPTLLVGAGDVVAEKFSYPEEAISVVLVRPQGPGVSTPLAYAAFDENPIEPADVEPLCEVFRSGGPTALSLAPLLANNLDPVACRLLPVVADVRAWLLAQDGVLGGQVTGSGSCVFGLCENDEDALRIARAAQDKYGAWAKSAHIVGKVC